jgi:glucose/mannose transport system substrate-binding protein
MQVVRSGIVGLNLFFGACIAACGSSQASGPPDVPEAHYLEVEAWLSAGPERQAMDALIEVFRRRDPEIQVLSDEYYIPARSLELDQRFAMHVPPDSLRVIDGIDTGQWINQDVLASLDVASATDGWSAVFPKQVLDSVSGKGSLYGVPLDIERDNTLFFDKAIFADNGLSPPTTVADVLAAAAALSAKGTTALSMSGAGWAVASTLFESVLVAEAGPDFYEAYLTGQLAPDAQEMQVALADLAKLADYADPDLATTNWGDATLRFCNGQTAMLVMPDFVKMEFAAAGCFDAAKIGYVTLEPPETPTFVFLGLGFVVPREAAHQVNGVQFVRAVGSREGQAAFNLLKSTVPARIDVDMSGFDFVSIAEAADYRAAGEHLVLGYAGLTPSNFQDAVNPALAHFVDSTSADYKNIDAVLAVLRSNYALLKR